MKSIAAFVVLAASIAQAQTAPTQTLKDAYQGLFRIGAALNPAQFEERDALTDPIIESQFNQISPENALKWQSVHPETNTYSFDEADKYVAFGEKHHMFILGHCLVWHSQVPRSVFVDADGNPLTRDALLERMHDHIRTVVGRYKGRVNGWDVVNEALNEDGTMRQSQWYKIIGDDFIVKAFQWAHEADPDAELYYNDYSLENEAKRKGAVELMKKLKAAGAPITGIGLQGHLHLDAPDAKTEAETIEAFAALGLKVNISEMDVDVLPRTARTDSADVSAMAAATANSNPYVASFPEEMQQALAKRYAELFQVYVDHHASMERVTLWGVSDGGSWLNNFPTRGRTNYPLLFDREGKPKPAFFSVVKVGKSASRAAVQSTNVGTLDGQIGIHDPSTVIESNGKYYVWGTGGSGLVSDDGWTWRRGANLPRRELAPDVIHIGDRFYIYTATNVGAQPAAVVHMSWTKSLDPESPDYKFQDGGVVASSDGVEDSNAIDPGVFLDPKTGKLWLVYGSYFGYIRQVELDPKTGKRINPNDKPRNVAINCEASDMMYHDGWYYLLATHGSCCRGADSGYNIRMGRSRSVNGPFLDAEGVDMIQGGGKLLIGSEARKIGAGHFGLLDLGDGVQKFSFHWEADLDRGGASVLDIRPLLWKDGWPVAGENLKENTYELLSLRTGTALELAVEGMPVGGRPTRGPRPPSPAGAGGPPGGMFAGTGGVIADQDVAQVSKNWPSGDTDVRMANFMSQSQQKWAIKAVPNVGGYPGSPYFKITIAGTDRALAATAQGELVVVAAFTAAPEQLWRFDQLADGTWRIMPKMVPNSKEPMALSAIGASSATLSKFDPASDKQHWIVKLP